jgi:hypothetical protein
MRAARLAVLAVAALTPFALAQTQLYIGEYQFQAARMAAVNLDGTNPHQLFALAPSDWLPIGVTFSPATNRLFWMDSGGASDLHSATTSGASPVFIASVPGFARGISLDASGRIYFSTNNMVDRINADGTGLITIYTSPTTDPVGNPRVDATNSHVYVGAAGVIVRMDLSGNNQKTIVRGISQPRAIALDVAEGFIYWIDADTISDYIGRARLDGTDFRVLIDHSPNSVGSSGLSDLIVDPVHNKLYFADELTGQVWSANTDGTNAVPIYTSPAGLSPAALTFDIGEPAQALMDCNGNGMPDDTDIAGGAPDCDNNGRIDTCQTRPCPARTFLLDQGDNAANNNSRALGAPSQWQIFQPFDVAGAPWHIGEVAVDGFNSNWVGNPATLIKLFPDNGTGTAPNETTPIATTALNLTFNTNNVNWVYAPLTATLAPARYWIRIEAADPINYSGSINFGFAGLQSKSRGSSGVFTAPASPIALRIIRAPSCGTADFNCDGDVGTDADIESFFACLAGTCPPAPCTNNADFNADGDIGTDADIEAFFRVLAGGSC